MEWLNSIKTVGVETQADGLLLNRKRQKKITLYAHLLHLFIRTSKKMNGSYMTDKTHMQDNCLCTVLQIKHKFVEKLLN